MTLFRLNSLCIEKPSTVSRRSWVQFQQLRRMLKCRDNAQVIFPEAHNISICDFKILSSLKIGIPYLCMCSVIQSYPSLCSSMGCSPTGSSVHGLL